ncbi:RNA-dependent RNA polymerase [Beihai narna-like virus 20]|uniref:RNA-dependent RNA polymerase n=1 Tax=Beihai narna-like virus 20 TaxID=1922448 RepID=UPI00090BE1A2|nr:RNA-dependent RNA polymerase [Beihai narna-like virus 20]APG77099.1 RNA-dependent RNA polymerase [Beihai narna-like virus 20]
MAPKHRPQGRTKALLQKTNLEEMCRERLRYREEPIPSRKGEDDVCLKDIESFMELRRTRKLDREVIAAGDWYPRFVAWCETPAGETGKPERLFGAYDTLSGTEQFQLRPCQASGSYLRRLRESIPNEMLFLQFLAWKGDQVGGRGHGWDVKFIKYIGELYQSIFWSKVPNHPSFYMKLGPVVGYDHSRPSRNDGRDPLGEIRLWVTKPIRAKMPKSRNNRYREHLLQVAREKKIQEKNPVGYGLIERGLECPDGSDLFPPAFPEMMRVLQASGLVNPRPDPPSFLAAWSARDTMGRDWGVPYGPLQGWAKKAMSAVWTGNASNVLRAAHQRGHAGPTASLLLLRPSIVMGLSQVKRGLPDGRAPLETAAVKTMAALTERPRTIFEEVREARRTGKDVDESKTFVVTLFYAATRKIIRNIVKSVAWASEPQVSSIRLSTRGSLKSSRAKGGTRAAVIKRLAALPVAHSVEALASASWDDLEAEWNLRRDALTPRQPRGDDPPARVGIDLDDREADAFLRADQDGGVLPLSDWTSIQYPLLDDALSLDTEWAEVRLAPIYDAGKTRTISADHEITQVYGDRVLREVLAPIRRYFPAANGTVTSAMLAERLGKFPGTGTLLSGDFTSATDSLDGQVSRIIALATAQEQSLSGPELRQLYASLTNHMIKNPSKEEGAPAFLPQARGQLMGSFESFPVLCVANLVVAWLADSGLSPSDVREEYRVNPRRARAQWAERIKRLTPRRQERLPALVNGDDLLIGDRPPAYFEAWGGWCESVGWKFSPSKNGVDSPTSDIPYAIGSINSKFFIVLNHEKNSGIELWGDEDEDSEPTEPHVVRMYFNVPHLSLRHVAGPLLSSDKGPSKLTDPDHYNGYTLASEIEKAVENAHVSRYSPAAAHIANTMWRRRFKWVRSRWLHHARRLPAWAGGLDIPGPLSKKDERLMSILAFRLAKGDRLPVPNWRAVVDDDFEEVPDTAAVMATMHPPVGEGDVSHQGGPTRYDVPKDTLVGSKLTVTYGELQQRLLTLWQLEQLISNPESLRALPPREAFHVRRREALRNDRLMMRLVERFEGPPPHIYLANDADGIEAGALRTKGPGDARVSLDELRRARFRPSLAPRWADSLSWAADVVESRVERLQSLVRPRDPVALRQAEHELSVPVGPDPPGAGRPAGWDPNSGV